MRTERDTQRSKVYAWERRIKGYHRPPEWKTLDEVIEFARPIWSAERGRYGRAGVPMPSIERPHRGQRSALAHSDHRITLPLWARQGPVVLHEMAHQLTPDDAGHGARFVSVLIGLLSRHLGYDANELMALADEMGVKYHVRSIGVVPVRGPAWFIERALREEKPMTEMELACWCDLTYLQVRGAAMHLIRNGLARWLRGKLVPMVDGVAAKPAPAVARSEPLTMLEKARMRASPWGVTVWSRGDGAAGVELPRVERDKWGEIEWFKDEAALMARIEEVVSQLRLAKLP